MKLLDKNCLAAGFFGDGVNSESLGAFSRSSWRPDFGVGGDPGRSSISKAFSKRIEMVTFRTIYKNYKWMAMRFQLKIYETTRCIMMVQMT